MKDIDPYNFEPHEKKRKRVELKSIQQMAENFQIWRKM